MGLHGEAVSIPCQGRKTQLGAAPLPGFYGYIKMMHLDRDWKGIWKNQIYGLSCYTGLWANF